MTVVLEEFLLEEEGRCLKALDLFCGLGGWSDGLALEGFDVLGVEIEPKIARLYKHPVICADVKTLDASLFKGFDLIVGSPPCRDFSSIVRLWGHTWKRKPDPQFGLKAINAFLKIIEDAEPKYWLMENVPGLKKHFPNPRVETYLGVRTMKRCFWGNFPSFLIFRTQGKTVYSKLHRYQRKARIKEPKASKWERAKIPLPIARALGSSVRQVIEGNL